MSTCLSSCSKSRLTCHQLFGRLKSPIPTLRIYLPKRQILILLLGLRIDNPSRGVISSLLVNACFLIY